MVIVSATSDFREIAAELYIFRSHCQTPSFEPHVADLCNGTTVALSAITIDRRSVTKSISGLGADKKHQTCSPLQDPILPTTLLNDLHLEIICTHPSGVPKASWISLPLTSYLIFQVVCSTPDSQHAVNQQIRNVR